MTSLKIKLEFGDDSNSMSRDMLDL